MSDIFSSLTMASRALQAQQVALNTTGQNIANVNTPGYTKRVVDFVSVPPPDSRGAGAGVDVSGIRALRDQFLDARVIQEVPAQGRAAAVADGLAVVETTLGKPGQSIDGQLSAFFDAFSSLAADPQSATARYQTRLRGDAVALAFRSMSDQLTAAMQGADTKVRGAVEQVNSLTSQIAKINATLSGSSRGAYLNLEDTQAQLVRQVAGLMDVSVLPRAQGGVDITFGNGHPLVMGATDYALTAPTTPPSGYAAVTSAGTNVSSEITGGTLGGLLQVRDVTLPGYLAQLDTLASQTVAQVNAFHSAGYDQSGAVAGNFFAYSTPPVGVAGAAAAMIVDPTVEADTTKIAASLTGTAGDNGTARAIAALRDAKVLGSGTATLTDGWSQLVFRVGTDRQTALQEQQTRADVVAQVDLLRDQVSGVSLDEEATQMIKYQRAYEANARFFAAVNSAIDDMLAMVIR